MERLTEVGQTRDGRELVGGARDEAREATLRRWFFCSHSACCYSREPCG